MPRSAAYKALVLGNDSRSFLGVVRSLGRGGVEVHVAWHDPDDPASSSRYINASHQIARYRADDRQWKDELIGVMCREQFDLVIPCHDQDVVPLQLHRRELECYGKIYLLPDEVFQIVSDKIRTSELARSLGVHVPRELVVRSVTEAEAVRGSVQLPVFLKPHSSFVTLEPDTRQQVRKLVSWEQFYDHLNKMLSKGPVAVQENFVGTGVGLELLVEDGEPLMSFQHERIHEPTNGGGSSYRRGVPVSDELLNASLKLLRALSYTGVVMLEFKVNLKTGQWVLIEINGRFWGSLPLALASGVDFPLALFRLLVEGKRPSKIMVRHGLRCRHLLNDFWWQIANRRARSAQLAWSVPAHRELWETICAICLLRERIDTWAIDDISPMALELLQLFRELHRPLRKRIRVRCLTSIWGRKLIARRARARVRRAETLLFVCKGNVCRSPFAEHYCRRIMPSVRSIRSAGFLHRSDRPAADRAIMTAKTWQVDLSRHRSQVVSEELIADADVVFVFDNQGYETLTEEFRNVEEKISFLGSLDPEQPLFIEDPWGCEEIAFQNTFARIAAALQKGAATTHCGSSSVRSEASTWGAVARRTVSADQK
jgi:protein-tyrosine-phosphatase/predicted ATP-grasp superfamily ATP-dependent carboligase